MGQIRQYCYKHKVMEDYPSCETNALDSGRGSSNGSKNAQLSKKDRPVIWEHPVTGEPRFPGRNDTEMPQYYKDQGYRRREFNSYNEHQKFCKDNNLVNHAAEGIRDSASKGMDE